MATKKSTAAKKTSTKKSTAKKKSTKTAVKTASRQPAAKRKSSKKSGALHNVARSIGSTLGSFAKKTSEVVDAAKNALPFGSGGESPQE